MNILFLIKCLIILLYVIGVWYYAGAYDNHYSKQNESRIYAIVFGIGVILWPLFWVFGLLKNIYKLLRGKRR